MGATLWVQSHFVELKQLVIENQHALLLSIVLTGYFVEDIATRPLRSDSVSAILGQKAGINFFPGLRSTEKRGKISLPTPTPHGSYDKKVAKMENSIIMGIWLIPIAFFAFFLGKEKHSVLKYKFYPFANESDALLIGELNIENRVERESVFDGRDFAWDKGGPRITRELKSLLERVVDSLQSDPSPDHIQKNGAGTVANPFLNQQTGRMGA